MLRQIVSVSLAMAACTTLIPTNANAVSLTFLPAGTAQKKPGDSITFKLSLNPMGTITFKSFDFDWDGNELSFDTTSDVLNENTKISNTTTIANVKFDVLSTVQKDGNNDFFNVKAVYDTDIQEGVTIVTGNTVDVVPPVPEPLTILGSATALGFGALLKREHSKKQKKSKQKG